MTGIIYGIKNNKTNKFYIGQTIQKLSERKYQHKRDSYKPKYYIHRSIRKYGFENFDFFIIKEINTDELDKKEQFYIKIYNSLYPNGYNMTTGGQIGFKLTEKTIKKQILYRKSEKFKEIMKNAMNKQSVKNKMSNSMAKKKFLIITPNGIKIVINNLQKFCRKNGLQSGALCETGKKNGKRKQHKGYKLIYKF